MEGASSEVIAHLLTTTIIRVRNSACLRHCAPAAVLQAVVISFHRLHINMSPRNALVSFFSLPELNESTTLATFRLLISDLIS